MDSRITNRVLLNGYHRQFNIISSAALVFQTLYSPPSLEGKFPIVRENVDPNNKQNEPIVAYLSSRYKTTFVGGMKSLQSHFSCYELILAQGVTLGFSFRTAKDLQLNRRFVNIQFVIRDRGSKANGLKELVKFIRFVEAAPDNDVEMLIYKLGEIDGAMIARPALVTTDRYRLERIYKRLLRSKQINGTEYYTIAYNPKYPKFPKQLYNELQ
jgi:hypothetical protein